MFVVWACTVACTPDDIGECCALKPGGDPSLIPIPERDANGEFKNVVSVSLKLSCEEAVCVSYKGSMGFCSRECAFSGSCPEGYNCEKVIVSRSGPNPDEGPRAYCVKGPAGDPPQPFMCTRD